MQVVLGLLYGVEWITGNQIGSRSVCGHQFTSHEILRGRIASFHITSRSHSCGCLGSVGTSHEILRGRIASFHITSRSHSCGCLGSVSILPNSWRTLLLQARNSFTDLAAILRYKIPLKIYASQHALTYPFCSWSSTAALSSDP